MKVLLVEQEPGLRQQLFAALKKRSFVCEQALTFREAFQKINNYEYDCVILELELAGGNGLRLVEKLKQENQQTAIIITSAKQGVADRIIGLDAGADDYLVKPYDIQELLARIKAVLRRRNNQYQSAINLGALQIDLDARSLRVYQQEVNLTKKEYDILIYLIRNKNRVVTKESLAEHLWGDYMDNASSYDFIYAHLKNLRKKLEEKDCGGYVKTVYGLGYKFSLP